MKRLALISVALISMLAFAACSSPTKKAEREGPREASVPWRSTVISFSYTASFFLCKGIFLIYKLPRPLARNIAQRCETADFFYKFAQKKSAVSPAPFGFNKIYALAKSCCLLPSFETM